MWFTLRYLYLATVVLCIEQPKVENVGGVKQNVHFRRAVDGTRGRKYFNPYEDGSYNDYGSSGGDYDSSRGGSGFSDIRGSVPGEPGVDYPVYTSVPTTRFSCEGRVQGYYADEEAGCQSFHVCHDVMVSSFICPVGSIFSQELLTCDWWNKVDCSATEGFYTSGQGIYEDSNQMIQKAYAMMQLPVRNGVSNDPEIGVSRINTMNIGFRENGATNDRGRGSYATPLDRGTDNYKITNFDIGRNRAVVTEENQSKQNIIKVNLRPKDFEVNYQGLNSRLNDRAKDSSIIYIEKNVNDNSQGVYSTLRPDTLQNYFENSYQQNDEVSRNEFQPSYAPTVPTVTTTTRKLYSPTVPTTYRLATIPYNKYDQDLQSSDHLYTHSGNINLMTTESTIEYEDTRVEDDISSNPAGSQNKENEPSGYVDDTVANKGQYQENFAEVVQSKESITIPQSFDRNMNRGGGYDQKETKNEDETNLQLGESMKEDTYISSSESILGNTRTRFGTESSGLNSNVSGSKRSYQHFYTDLVSVGSRHGERESRKLNGILGNNNTDVTVKREDDNNSNLLSTQSRIPPLIVEIPRPSAPSLGRPVVDIADQLFSYDSFVNMSSSTTETPPPVIPPKLNFTNRIGVLQRFDLSARIPPLIPQFSQSAESSGSQPSSGIDDNETINSPPRIPPLISDNPQSAELPGVDLSDKDAPTQTFEFATRIPLLIPQSSLSVPSIGSQSSTGVDDNVTLDSPPRIPPLISEIPQSVESPGVDSSNEDDSTQSFDSPSGIPPLIPQSSQSASSGSQSSSGFDGNDIFESPTRIPPLIYQIPEFSQSPGIESSDVDHGTQTFEFADRIPLLIPQSSESAASPGSQSPTRVDDNGTLDSPPRIPPLISEIPQSAESSGVDYSEKDDPTQSFEFASSIPPLIPQSSESAASPGSKSSVGIDDNGILATPPRIPPLIFEIPQSVESPGVDSTNEDDPTQSFDSPSRIPPLIPQSSQSAASSGSQSSSGFDGNDIFESPTRIPPLISQIPGFSQSPGIVSSDDDHGTQTFEFAGRIPPLIPQSSQSAASSGSQSPSGIDDKKIFNSPPETPPVISQIPQSIASPEVNLSNMDDSTQSFDSPSRISPLIPQSSQSAASSGSHSPSGIDDNKTFNPPPRIPPLISQIPQSVGSPGVDSSNKDDRTQSFEFASSIPPLIPQFPQAVASSGSQSASGIDDNKTFNPPPRIPPLISQISQSVGSPGVDSSNKDDRTQSFEFASNIPPLIPQSSQSVASSGSQSASGIDDNKTFSPPPRIPPLISQISQSVGSSGVDSSNKDDRTQSFEVASNIPPLIPQFSQSAASSGSQSASGIDDNKTVNSPSRIPPLISQISQSVGSSGVDSLTKDDRTQSFEFASNIPPLIPQSSQSAASSGSQSPTRIGDNDTFNSLTTIPPRISEIPQSVASTGADSLNGDDNIHSFESSAKIPPLISQSSPSVTSSGAHSPSAIDENKTFDLPLSIRPIISQVPQFFGTLGVNSLDGIKQTHTVESSTRFPQFNSQTFQSISPSKAHPPHGFGEKHISIVPPRLPTFNSPILRPLVSPGIHSTGVLDQKQTSDPSSIAIPQHLKHIHSSTTNSYNRLNSFNPSPSTDEAAHFTFQGQYQRPLPFSFFNVPTRRPEHQFGTTPAYDFSAGYGSRFSTKGTTVRPLGHLPDSAIEKFRINVPDLPSTKESQFTQSTTLPTPRNPYLPGVSTSKTLGSQESVGSFTEKPFIASSRVNQTRVDVSNVVSHFPTADYPQLSVTDRPKTAFASLSPKNYSYSQISTGNNENKHTHTVVKPSTLFPPFENVDRSNYDFFKQAFAPIPSISDNRKPISTSFGTGNWPKYNDDPQFTIRGALQYPTATSFPPFSNTGPTYLPQSAGSSADATGQNIFSSKYLNTGDSPTYGSHSENLSYNKNQVQSTTPSVVKTSPTAGNNFRPTSSHSPLKNSGYSNGRLEFSTPINVLDKTSIKSAENLDTKRQEILQSIGTDSLPPGFSQIEASLNNDDAPYEVSFTIKGDEDFHPSGDFINKLLAQHDSNFSLGFTGLEGFEIIKSENPGDPDDVDIVKPTPLTNIESSVAPTVMRLFDARGSFSDQRTEQTNGFFNQKSNSGIPRTKVGETHATKIEPLKPDNLPRPFFFGNDHSAALPSRLIFESNTLSTTKPPVLDSILWNGKPQDSLYLSELKTAPEDINISLGSLFESVSETPTSSPLRKEDILEQLTKHFGQPLYNNNNPQRYFIPTEASRNVDHNAGRQFDSIEQYRVGKKDESNKDSPPTSTAPPTTTTTTTPKTFVETEFIPSIGFSFDSDEGRNQYVDAILHGFFTDHRSVDPWTDDADAYRVSRENSKSKSKTTEIK